MAPEDTYDLDANDFYLNSYFGSNGTVPLAKEKDVLLKLFEKYRGKPNCTYALSTI